MAHSEPSTTVLVDGAARQKARASKPRNLKWIAPTLYIFFLLLPIP
mgnify:FL=1